MFNLVTCAVQTNLSLMAIQFLSTVTPFFAAVKGTTCEQCSPLKKKKSNVESFNSFPKHNAISEHLSFLRRVCVQNEVTVIHKFSRCEIRFVGRFSASFYTKFTLVNV